MSEDYVCEAYPSMTGAHASSFVQKGMAKASLIQRVECNSTWLARSLIVYTQGSLSSDAFSGLAMVAWDDIADIRVLNPMQFLVTLCSFETMRFNLSRGVLPISSFCTNLK